MLNWHQLLGESVLELRLLRKGHDTRAAADVHCADCHRVPLTGERVSRFGQEIVCTLCSARRAGAPSETAAVQHVEHGVSVRRLPLPRAA